MRRKDKIVEKSAERNRSDSRDHREKRWPAPAGRADQADRADLAGTKIIPYKQKGPVSTGPLLLD